MNPVDNAPASKQNDGERRLNILFRYHDTCPAQPDTNSHRALAQQEAASVGLTHMAHMLSYIPQQSDQSLDPNTQ